MEFFKLDWGELAKCSLPSLAVILGFNPGDDGEGQSFFRAPPLKIEHVLLQQSKEAPMAALSPAAPTRPIDPTSPLFLRTRTKALDLNWLPRSEWTMVPTGLLVTIALRSARTASDAFIRSSSA